VGWPFEFHQFTEFRNSLTYEIRFLLLVSMPDRKIESRNRISASFPGQYMNLTGIFPIPGPWSESLCVFWMWVYSALGLDIDENSTGQLYVTSTKKSWIKKFDRRSWNLIVTLSELLRMHVSCLYLHYLCVTDWLSQDKILLFSHGLPRISQISKQSSDDSDQLASFRISW
jgi:hypothetical protein